MDTPPSPTEFFDAFGTRIRRGDFVVYARKYRNERLKRGTVERFGVSTGRRRPPHQYLVIRPERSAASSILTR